MRALAEPFDGEHRELSFEVVPPRGETGELRSGGRRGFGRVPDDKADMCKRRFWRRFWPRGCCDGFAREHLLRGSELVDVAAAKRLIQPAEPLRTRHYQSLQSAVWC